MLEVSSQTKYWPDAREGALINAGLKTMMYGVCIACAAS